MSEQTHKHNHEQHSGNHEVDNKTKELLEEMTEKGRESAEEHAEKVADSLEDIRAEALDKSETAEDLAAVHEAETEEPEAPLLVNADLKNIKYKRTLQSVRKDLKPTERVMSKVIHNPAVDAVSEVAGKTIARPSGFLAGAIFAFIGSSVFYGLPNTMATNITFCFRHVLCRRLRPRRTSRRSYAPYKAQPLQKLNYTK